MYGAGLLVVVEAGVQSCLGLGHCGAVNLNPKPDHKPSTLSPKP